MSVLKTASLCALLITTTPVASWAETQPMRAEAGQATPSEKIDRLHTIWSGLLERYVTPDEIGLNLFDYQALKGSAVDSRLLDEYIERLASQKISTLPAQDQFAAWANLYNALTVQIIIQNYPVDSIRDIRSGLLSAGPWKRELINVEGRTLTLDNIEHDILRAEFKDPRVHYAVNCASIGCPNLKTTAFRGATLDDALNDAARAYINHPRGVHFTRRGDLVASKIYSWFQEDFGGTEAGVIEHLKRFANPDLATRLNTLDDIRRFEYDWSLNDTSRKGRK